MVRFGETLQGKSANEALIKLGDNEVKILEKIKQYAKKRAKIDQDYARQMSQLNEEYGMKNLLIGMKNNGINKTMEVWLSMIEAVDSLCSEFSKKAATSSISLCERLDSMINRKKQVVNKYIANRRSLETARMRHTQIVEQHRQQFHTRLRDANLALKALKDITNKGKSSGKKYDQAKDRYVKTVKILFSVSNEYYLSQVAHNEYQVGYQNYALPALLNAAEDTHLMYTSEMKEILKDICCSLTLYCEEMIAFKNTTNESIDQISIENEFSEFVASNRDEKPPPNRILEEVPTNGQIPGLKINGLSINNINFDSICTRKDNMEMDISAMQEELNNQVEIHLKLQNELSEIPYWNEQQRVNDDYINKSDESLIINYEIGKLRCELNKLKSQVNEIETAVSQVGDNTLEFEKTLPGIPEDSTLDRRSRLKSSESDPNLLPKSFKKLKNLFKGNEDKHKSGGGVIPDDSSSSLSDELFDSPYDEFSENPSDDGLSYGRTYENINAKIEEESYYYGVFSRQDAEKLVEYDGDYLIRISPKSIDNADSTEKRKLVLTTRHNGKCLHFIVKEENGYFKFDDKGFGTVQELVQYYRCNQIPLLSKSPAIIVNPIAKKDRENLKLMHDDVECTKKLGEGCFGEVMLGKIKSSGLTVAVKQCKGTLDETLKERFLLEADILKQYNHPHIVRLIGICADKEPVYIVMEYMNGGDFHSYLRNKNKDHSPVLLLKMMCHAASGMAYLESTKCIHRDLAARNCLMTSDYTLKISDFGMAREGDDEDVYLVTDRTKKMPIKWTAPEAVHFGRFTTQSDVWSYGVLLWEAFSRGHMPYPNMDNRKALKYVDEGNRMSEPNDTPPGVYDIMLDCWQAKPEDRPSFDVILKRMEKLCT